MKKSLVLFAVLLLSACTSTAPSQPSASNDTLNQSLGPVTVVEDLDTPWAIDFFPDGRIIFTERPGRVHIRDEGSLKQVADLDVSERSESGLHGVAVDPNFPEDRYVYLYYTYETGNRVSRFTLNGTLQDEEVLLEGIPSARYHDGGRIKFGPDGKLYVATGDATNPSSSQSIDSLAGKILRMNEDGSVPEDNPFNNYVYSYGHRNPQGIAWDGDGTMYEAEHGPTRHDEINLIREGVNYGWPETCGGNPEARDPIRCYTEFTLAPSGVAWSNGSLYVAGLRSSQVRKLVVDDGTVDSEEVFIDGFGRIREVVAHEGYLYFATSNRDGRGLPAANDDRIMRLKVS